MEGVEFEQDNIDFTMKRNIKRPATFSNFLVKKGVAANERQANVILLVLALVCLLVSSFLFVSSVSIRDKEITYDMSDALIQRLPQAQQDKIKKANLRK